LALTYLDTATIRQQVGCAWQKAASGVLATMDFTDSLPTGVTFNTDPPGCQYTNSQIVAAESAVVCNKDGLMDGYTDVGLNYQYTTSQSESHSVTQSTAVGAKFSFEVNQVVTKETAEFSINFTFSSTDTTTQTVTQSENFNVTMQVWPPTGKIYKAQLLCEQQTITIPYTVEILVTGMTSADFALPTGDPSAGTVNMNSNMNAGTVNTNPNPNPNNEGPATAGQAFGWIKTYKCAGSDDSAYSDNGNNVGAVTLTGTVTINQYANFVTNIVDATNDADAIAECEAMSPSASTSASTTTS
jgi:hypothetical protein